MLDGIWPGVHVPALPIQFLSSGNYLFFFLPEYGDVVRVKWERYINCLHKEGTHPMVDIVIND